MTESKKFSMKGFITEICEDIGPRLGTSESEKRAGLRIKEILEDFTNGVELEDFECHPKGFLEFLKVAFVAGVVGFIFFFFLPIISFFLCIYVLSTFIMEQMLLKEYVDFLFPKRTGTNVIGKLKSRQEPKKIVIFSAHHDSAYEFPLFDKFKEKFGLLAYVTAALMILSAVASLVKFILDLLEMSTITSTLILLIFPVLALILGAYIAFNLHSDKLILGANDNLSGVAVVIALAEHFSQHTPKNIELWFISFSCEECMRGSKRFAQRHKDELKDSNFINFDMVGCGNISVISKEPQFTSRHSKELAKEFHQASINANSELPIKTMEFGGTDAANLTKAGLKAISVMGLTPHDYPATWHVMEDTPENIDKVLLEKTVKVSIQYVQDLDSNL
ncbi:MAG: M20/M25/M40 family metallo-hydrolase [Promethearchaeota archaeon]|nr:MAG: M20/M25/M40 family metallo-hydrolase [Candidatus Lokiarchaeota archaeon]